MRARYYNPHLCRFINADPAGFSGGLNFYAYADGNPVSLLDPFGLGAVGESSGGSWLNNAFHAVGNFLMGPADPGNGSVSFDQDSLGPGIDSYHNYVE